MSQTVYTDLGPGQIVASETTRGRKQYRVAGDFGEVWIDEAKLASQLEAGYDDHMFADPERHPFDPDSVGSPAEGPYDDPFAGSRMHQHWQNDPHSMTNTRPSYDDMGYNDYAPLATEQGHDWDGHYGSYHEGWAPVDHDNSVSLPYNPTPQYPAIPGDTESTIQPDHEIDADERLHPSNSITFEDRDESEAGGWPAPSPRNFASDFHADPTNPSYVPGGASLAWPPELEYDNPGDPDSIATLRRHHGPVSQDIPAGGRHRAGGFFDGPDDGPGPEHDPHYHQRLQDGAREQASDEKAFDAGWRPHTGFLPLLLEALPELAEAGGAAGAAEGGAGAEGGGGLGGAGRFMPHGGGGQDQDQGDQAQQMGPGPGWDIAASRTADFDPDAPPVNLDPAPVNKPDLSMPPAPDKPGVKKKGPTVNEHAQSTLKRLRVGPGWDDHVYQGSRPSDRAGDAWAEGRDKGWVEHGQQDIDEGLHGRHREEDWADAFPGGEGEHYNTHHGGLDDRYAELMMDADFHNNPVAQFRHDPDAYINRVGHVSFEGHNPRMAEYMDLVEANAGIREAAWSDVRKKAMRLRAEGRVHTEDLAPDRIYASVEGDHGTYETMISKKGAFGGYGGGHAISNWHCSCEWGKWAFQRRYTFVGRLCSHGYATYLTMQSAHLTDQPRIKRQTPYPKRRKRADALQMEPQRLVPEMVVNDTEDEPLLVDVTKDERKTTGPDGIVHFSNLTDAEREILGQRAINIHGAYRLGGDQHDDDWKVEDAVDGVGALEEIRDWADKPQQDDLGHMDRRVDDIRDAVEEARDAGTDADQLVASRHFAAPGDEQPVAPFDDPYGGGGGAAAPFEDPYGADPNGIGGGADDGFPGGGAGGGIGGEPGTGYDPSGTGIGGYGDAPETGIGGYGAAPETGIGGGSTPQYTIDGSGALGGGGNESVTPPGGATDTGNPSGGAAGGAGGVGSDGTYTVKPGDTLSDIANQYGGGKSYQDLATSSGISNPDLIHPGDTIKGLGGGGSAAGGASTSSSSSPAAGTSDPSGGGSAGDSGYSSLMGGGGSSGASGASNPASPDALTGGGGSSGAGGGDLGSLGLSNDSKASGSSIDNTDHNASRMSSADYRDWHIAAYGVPPRTAAPGATLDDTDGAPPPSANGETPSKKQPSTMGQSAPDESALDAGLSDTGPSAAKPSGPGTISPGIGGTNAPGLGGHVAPTDGMGGMSGIGLPGGELSGLTNLIGEGVGALTSLPGLMGGGGLSGIGSALSGLGHLFGSREDYRQWHIAAYGTEPPQRQAAYPEPGDHHPFNGSGWPGDLEIGSSEDAMKSRKYEDVTDLNNTDYAGSPEALRTGGVHRVGNGPQRPPVVPEVIAERRPRNARQTLADVSSPDDFDPLAIRTAADFDDPYVDSEQAAVRTAAAGGDIVAQFQASEAGRGVMSANSGGGHDDIAGAASQFLQRTAGRNYSPAEQEALMREGDRGGARNLDELRLEGTHYSMNSVGLL